MTWTDKEYFLARWEHAFLLKAEGKTGEEIGQALGVSEGRARDLSKKFAKRLSRAMSAGTTRRRTRFWYMKQINQEERNY